MPKMLAGNAYSLKNGLRGTIMTNEKSGKNTIHKTKALALFSGGLDSMLAVKLMLEQNIEIEAVNFMTLFCLCDRCSVDRFSKELGIKVHKIFLGQEFLDVVANPPHGYGSQMNPCIDCRILMFKKAKELAEKIGAEFLVTGEVLDERPFSQRKKTMLLIEREAGLEGKIVRPLSAKLLPISEPEKKGLVDREKLLDIKGRRRLPQIELAKRFGIKEYPNPSGGCLLTDPRFAQRLKEHLKYVGKLTLEDVTFLKIGRHFRIDGVKIIVGRNKEENMKLLMISKSREFPYLEVVDFKGPITLYIGEKKEEVMQKAASITARYSDAPKTLAVKVRYKDSGEERIIVVTAIKDEELKRLMV